MAWDTPTEFVTNIEDRDSVLALVVSIDVLNDARLDFTSVLPRNVSLPDYVATVSEYIIDHKLDVNVQIVGLSFLCNFLRAFLLWANQQDDEAAADGLLSAQLLDVGPAVAAAACAWKHHGGNPSFPSSVVLMLFTSGGPAGGLFTQHRADPSLPQHLRIGRLRRGGALVPGWAHPPLRPASLLRMFGEAIAAPYRDEEPIVDMAARDLACKLAFNGATRTDWRARSRTVFCSTALPRIPCAVGIRWLGFACICNNRRNQRRPSIPVRPRCLCFCLRSLLYERGPTETVLSGLGGKGSSDETNHSSSPSTSRRRS